MALLRLPTLILLLGVAAIIAFALAAPSNAAAASCPAVQASVAQVSPRIIGGSVLCLVNRERTSRGLRGLRHAPALNRAASRYSRQMVAGHFFDHVSPSGSTVSTRV